MTTVLLLHAFPLSAAMWARQVEVLQAAGHRALAPDLPGFGTAAPLPEPSIDAFAAHAFAALDAAGVERAVLCGLSMGGYVALRMFAQQPARIAGLLLADTRADADSPAVRERRQAQIARIHSEGTGWLAETMLPLLLADTAPAELRDQVAALIAAAPADGVVGALQAMAGRPDSTDLLGQIEVPVATVAGSSDTLTPPAVMRPMASRIRTAICTALAGAGHLSNLELPEAFDQTLLRLCARVEAAEAATGAPHG